MAGWSDFREIAAWQHSQHVKVRIYALLERPKIQRDVKLSTQLRESARSAPSNIAEGFGRFGNKEFARFARISKGSLHESLNHLIDARDQRMITADELLIEEHHIKKAIDTVTGLIRHLERTQGPNPTEPDEEPGTSNPESEGPDQIPVAHFFNRLDSWRQTLAGAQFQACFRCAIPACRLLY